jgi:hypothetical protein
MLNTSMLTCIVGSTDSQQGQAAGFYKYGNEPLDFIKGNEFLENSTSWNCYLVTTWKAN